METTPTASSTGTIITAAPVETPVVANETPIPVIAPAPLEETHHGGSVGSVIAILLIVVLLVVGAFYVWGQRLSEERAAQTAAQGYQ